MKLLNLENKYFALIWWSIFMIFIPLDQEKVVIVCFIIFLYLLFIFMSNSISGTFLEKKNSILKLLTKSSDIQVSLLKDWVSEQRFLSFYFSLFQFLIIKFYYKINQYLSLSSLNLNKTSYLLGYFYHINRCFTAINQHKLVSNISLNLFGVKALKD